MVPFQIPWPRDRRLQAICAAILDQPGLSRSIEDWGDEVGASARTLIRLFQSELGLNYRQWCSSCGWPTRSAGWRWASRSRVAASLGYRSASAFSAMFRRALGARRSALFAGAARMRPRASGTRRISAPLKPVPGRIGDSARTPRRRRPRPARNAPPSVPDRPGHVWLPKPNRRKAGLSRYALESPAMSNPQHSSDAPRGKRRFSWKPFLIKTGVAVAGAGVRAAVLLGLALALAWPSLPDLHAMTDYRPRVPLRIYTADKVLIGEYGEEHRNVLRFDEIPEVMRNAVLSAEDDRFTATAAWTGWARAILTNVVKGSKSQGGSTITMQVARNFYLSSEKTYSRKFYELLLTFKIESELSKDEILALYMNQIYLGHRAYGFAAASRTYLGKPLSEVTPAEAAMLAGIPKAPSRFNPITNFARAEIRQHYVLNRMKALAT